MKCFNRNQNHTDYVNISRRLRQEQPKDPGGVFHVGVVFHMIHTAPELDLGLARDYINTIRKTLNEDFGERTSDSHIYSELFLESYPLFQKDHYKNIYLDYLKLSAPGDIEFVEVGSASYHLQGYDAENQDLDYWDNLLKIETAPAVQPDKFLNLWICVGVKSPFLGYAQYPKVEISEQEQKTDGVVFFVTVTPFHLFKTITHEIGHWLGLNHLFHEDHGTFDDNVDDTPFQKDPCFGDPLMESTWPSSTYNNKISYHMFMNYMDYTDDMRMFMFTKNQVEKIRQVLLTVRRKHLKAGEQLFKTRQAATEPPTPTQPTQTTQTTNPSAHQPTLQPTTQATAQVISSEATSEATTAATLYDQTTEPTTPPPTTVLLQTTQATGQIIETQITTQALQTEEQQSPDSYTQNYKYRPGLKHAAVPPEVLNRMISARLPSVITIFQQFLKWCFSD